MDVLINYRLKESFYKVYKYRVTTMYTLYVLNFYVIYISIKQRLKINIFHYMALLKDSNYILRYK